MKKTNKIVVIGSSNTDMVVRVDHFPQPGETIIGEQFMTAAGGKGANQAVAVARLGGDVTFVCRLGNDVFGKQSLLQLQAEGMNTQYVKLTPGAASGVALIPVDKKGENTIIVASGANALLSAEDIREAENEIATASFVLMQLETPIEALICAAELAHKHDVKVVLNPAPFPKEALPDALLRNVDMIIPNETEAEYMTGQKVTNESTALSVVNKIHGMGVKEVIITVGKDGAYVSTASDDLHLVSSFPVEAVDTVAAGDTFCGALCVALSKGYCLLDAVKIGNKAASIAVTRVGAQPSVPTANEVFDN
ncbi:MAG: ribokinase [Bacteroidales bacterium]|nr:ribokinase [Bacteroidales bacterium]